MTNMLKSAALAALLAGGSAVALAPVAASAQETGPLVPGLGVANLEAVVANSNAFKAAQSQRPTAYKAQIDQAQARKAQIEAQLQPLAAKFERDRAAPGANQAALQQQYQVIQGIQQSGQQEIQRILQPVAYSEAYVNEQIEARLADAIKAAATKRRVSIVLNPQAVLPGTSNAYSINQDVLDSLNGLIPSATLTPPAGWLPRELREQQAQQQQGQAAPAPRGAQPQGR
jgi:Skp family chaperone for outer membrane proteins